MPRRNSTTKRFQTPPGVWRASLAATRSRSSRLFHGGVGSLLLTVACLAGSNQGMIFGAGPAAAQSTAGPSGRPLPRFVSLKSDRVNLRQGPGTDYPTSWVYRRAGLPVEIVKEFEAWRQVRDADGATGWILQSLLSGRRTALVLPWERKAEKQAVLVPVMEGDSASTRILARVEAGVIANVHSCDGRWCDVTIETFRGYVEQNKLWGVYPGELLK